MRPLGQQFGFTLTEALVSSSIIAVILGLLLSMTNQTERVLRGTTAKINQFQDSRLAFDAMTRRLSQATLNNYWDYEYETVSQTVAGRKLHTRVPVGYSRTADLRFRCGQMTDLDPGGTRMFRPTHGVFFQAPNGYAEDTVKHGVLDHLLNTWGYFVELNTEEEFLPRGLRGRVTPRKRFRLMEATEPTEKLRVYQFQQPRATDWFRPLITGSQRGTRPLAENIVALILLPKLAQTEENAARRDGQPFVLAPGYHYDSSSGPKARAVNSQHQLPPVLQVVMVAIDEESARRLDRDYRNQAAQGLDYGHLFSDPALLEDDPATPASGDGDLAKFGHMLTERLNVSYRVFTSNISLRGSKWSRDSEH